MEQLDSSKLVQNAILIPDGTFLLSRHRWDFQSKKIDDVLYFVDGGLDYHRRTNNGDEIDYCVYDDFSTEEIAEKLLWGVSMDSQGKTIPFHWKLLKDCVPGHLEAIIKNFPNSNPLHLEIAAYWLKKKSK